MKRNKSGTIQESFQVEIDSPFGSFLCEYSVLAYKQEADHRCIDSDTDYRGYTEINSVDITSIQEFSSFLDCYSYVDEGAMEVLFPTEYDKLTTAIWEDASIKINEGIGG